MTGLVLSEMKECAKWTDGKFVNLLNSGELFVVIGGLTC